MIDEVALKDDPAGKLTATARRGGRVLAELITARRSAVSALPWVGHHAPRWEPEPLRWLGVTAGLKAMAWADTEERLTGRPSQVAGFINRALGRGA
mgnify:CR=1 FL=1